MIFANFEVGIEEIDGYMAEASAPIRAVLISAEAVTDMTALDGLTDYASELRDRGIAVGIARLKANVADRLEPAGELADIAEAVYLEADDGVEALRHGTFGSS